MRNFAEEIRSQLAAEYPAWDIWLVYRAVGGITWCARRADGSGPLLNYDSPGTLDAAIGQAEQGT